MHKGHPIHGIVLLNGSLKTYVEPDTDQPLPSSLREIGESLLSILNTCGFYRVDVTCTMPEGHTKPITTATCYVPRKIPEKNGAT